MFESGVMVTFLPQKANWATHKKECKSISAMIALRSQQEQALAAKGADTNSSSVEVQKSAFPGGLPSFAEALWVLRTARAVRAATGGYVKEDIDRLASRNSLLHA
jgi:hypothetical protein